jgi:hypothetical protein
VIQAAKTKVVDHAHNHYLPEKYLSRHMSTNAKTFGFGVIASKAKQSRAIALTVTLTTIS